MEKLSMCRICLATDVRLCSVANHLRDMYERISFMTFKTEDIRPLVACYICHARLQNCYRLRTACLRSEELLAKMMSSGVVNYLILQGGLSTNSLSVLSVLKLSLGQALRNSTECEGKEETLQVLCDAEHNQQSTEDIEDIKFNTEDITIEENELNYESSPSAYNIRSEKRMDINDTMLAEGARVLNKTKIAAQEDTEDATTNKMKIKIEKIGNVINKEPKIVSKNKEKGLKKTISTSKILERCNKLGLNKCNNVVTSVVNDVCEEKSTNNISLEHNVSNISSGIKQFSCDYCKKCFRRKHNFINHVRMHTDGNQCNVCKKSFTLKSHLKSHILKHATDKPYQCNICAVFIAQKSSLIRHMRIHTDDKRYQCDIFKKCFNEKGYLQKHIRRHNGDKPYQCDVCQLFFSLKCNLQKHIRTHTGEKPYQCIVCNRSFREKSDLKRHIRTHTGEKPYQCHVCNKCFKIKGTLRSHITRTHKNDNN